RHADGGNGKRPDFDALAWRQFIEFSILQKAVLFQFVFDIRESKLSPKDGHIQFGKNPWQSADVVLVAMREQNGPDLFAVFGEIGNVRNDDVHAEKFRLGEHKPSVNHNNVVAPADRHAVHSELAKAAERYQMQFSCRHEHLMLAQ